MKILVIEDDDRSRILLESQLQDLGHTVLAAADGRAGLALAAGKPDVILCDIEMPRLNGYGVIEALRQQPGLSETPFIFLTGRTARAEQRKGMLLGADDYITKPFQIEEVIAGIAGVLAKRASLDRRLRHQAEENRREMSAPWSHELLTPLNGILGMASLLESESEKIPPAELREMARVIQQSARRQQTLALKLAHHFQLLQLQESGGSGPAVTADVATGLEDEMLGVARRSGRAADLRLHCAPAAVHIDPYWLRTAVAELADNAFKFSPAGTLVTMTGTVRDGCYRIEVTDRGPGMPAEARESVAAFRQFNRAKLEQQGLGLGLAMVRNIARLHHGGFGLEPGPDGTGLRAGLDLPLAK